MASKLGVQQRNALLKRFQTRKNAQVKYEYLRCFLIRRIAKLIYQLKHLTAHGSTQFLKNHLNSPSIFESMRQNEAVFNDLCRYARHPEEHPTSPAKTYNDKFVKAFFQSREAQKLFELMLDWKFHDPTPEVLCRKFQMRCCRSAHTGQCQAVWVQFRDWVYNEMPPTLGFQMCSASDETDAFFAF